ncbi:MAG TPA: AAA family ATPase, partial [archaeon]|nr:AAA family ATPase [archaeon]
TPRQNSTAANDAVRALLEKLTYLRANRKRPSRGYSDGNHPFQPIGYSGEWTPTILFEKGTEQVTYLEPPVIPNSVDEAKKNEIEWKTKKSTLLAALVDWLGRLELATHVEVKQSGASKDLHVRVAPKGQNPHDITEIGFGVSQVIPVLVAGLLQPEDSLLIVDLPEAHLHPRPQGDIADFFCSLALSGRTALVETHSEMFFHQLRLRAAMDPRLMENIAVYFIDRPLEGICSKPRLVDLGYDGELKWPDGFLQEAWEKESQISAVREAQRILRG